MQAVNQSRVEHALRLAGQGFHVIPVRDGAKFPPLISDFPTKASSDPAQICEWWQQWPDANIGLSTSRYGANEGLLLVDVDTHKGGDASLFILEMEGFDFPPTRTQRTPRGSHLIYRVPHAVKQGVDVLGKGIDTRSQGGYALAAGSVVAAGAYTMDNTPVAPAPQWLIDTCGDKPARNEASTVAVHVDQAAATNRAQEYLAGAPLAIEGQGGDATTVAVACRLRDFGVPESACSALMAAHWNERCSPPWDVADLAVKVGNAYRYARDVPGNAAPEAVFSKLEPAPGIIVKRSPMQWASLATRQPQPREWLIDHWLSYDPTLCAGRGGIGKTLIGQQVASALALGRDMLGSVAKPHTVLMWACEDDHDELWRRQIDMARYFNVPLADFEKRLIIEPRRGENNTLLTSVYGKPQFTPLWDELVAQVNDYGADVLILDNVGQTYGANENERHPVTMFMNGFAGVGRGRKVAPIVLAHPARAKGSEFAGNAAWENAARMRWFLNDVLPDIKQEDDAEPDPLVRYLCKRKMNYSVKDYRRLTYQNGVLVPDAAPAEGADLARKELAVRVVIAGIKNISAMGQHSTTASTSLYFLPKMLLQYKLGEGCTKRELDEAMRLAMGAGKIKTGLVGKRPNRTNMEGLVVVE